MINHSDIRRATAELGDAGTPISERPIAMSVQYLRSCEHKRENYALVPMIYGVSFSIYENEVLGIGGTDREELTILCEILGNMRPYYKGNVSLSKYGVPQSKRMLLSHLFYIDTDEMLYRNMTVLEQLLFATLNKNKKNNPIERQRNMLDFLVNLGFKKIALAKIGALTKASRMVIAVLLAALTDSDTIVVNLLNDNLMQEEIELLSKVINYMKSEGKTAVFVTMQPKLIGMTCEKVLFINEGAAEFFGTVDELCREHDPVVCMIHAREPEKIAQRLQQEIDACECVIEDENLFIRNKKDKKVDLTRIYDFFQQENMPVDFIRFNHGRVENSFNELMVKYDI